MKYLGVIIDGDWNYRAHFDMVAEKAEKTVGHLHKLMPNIRGPSENKRRLYASVVFSILLYGVPVWLSVENRNIRSRLGNITRRVAQRVCRTYSTVSSTAALIVAGTPPLHITAKRLAKAFFKIRLAEREWSSLELRSKEKINFKLKVKFIEWWKRSIT